MGMDCMDGAWVGTWRHHCPHGPIMAQFTSLGPKYSISGTTGKTTIARGAGSTGCFSSPRPCSSPRRTHTRSLPIALPGPGTYTLPRLVGPNTALIHTNPCCSMRGKSEHDGFAEDLSKTPGPAAFPKVELDVYKKRAPMYTMEPKSALEETKQQRQGRQTTTQER
uniref:Uncharacterized protein n=1 Tax=Strigops habroptila TaxID=2489341 RepID=A0A672THK4_STRHB